MCFFISLVVPVQKRPAGIQTSISRLAAQYALCLRGDFPSFQITDGHCSCRHVQAEGRALQPAAFLFIEELLKIEDIKNIKVGWTWAAGRAVDMKPEAGEVRCPLHEFATQNTAGELRPDVWYRLHDPNKYAQ